MSKAAMNIQIQISHWMDISFLDFPWVSNKELFGHVASTCINL
jgi:hypothetical protein